MLETEIVLAPKHYGTHYHRFTVNAQFVHWFLVCLWTNYPLGGALCGW